MADLVLSGAVGGASGVIVGGAVGGIVGVTTQNKEMGQLVGGAVGGAVGGLTGGIAGILLTANCNAYTFPFLAIPKVVYVFDYGSSINDVKQYLILLDTPPLIVTLLSTKALEISLQNP